MPGIIRCKAYNSDAQETWFIFLWNLLFQLAKRDINQIATQTNAKLQPRKSVVILNDGFNLTVVKKRNLLII